MKFGPTPIPTDGLILALDAGNPLCMLPGGTSARNIITGGAITGANGNPGTGTHTPDPSNFPAYSGEHGGVFDCLGAKSMNCDEDLGDHTKISITMWFYKTSTGTQYFSDARNDGGTWFLTNYLSYNYNFSTALRYNYTDPYNSNPSEFINKWICMTVTSDSSGSKLYLNGTEVSNYVSQNSVTEQIGKNFRIGTRYTGPSAEWTGMFGNIFIHNRVITSTEALQIYDAGKFRFK